MRQNGTKNNINQCLREERLHHGWSQQQVADLLNTTVNNVSRWELGQTSPGPYLRAKLSELFNKPPQALGLYLPKTKSSCEPEQPKKVHDPQEAPVPPGSLPTLWHVPFRRNPLFTGREEILQTLHKKLNREHMTALTRSWAISGLGGIGKTQIALEYAYQHRYEYRFVLWVNASTHETLFSDLVTIAHLLQLPEKDESEQSQIIQAIKQWFASHYGWLFILDNADNLSIVQDVLPTELSGHVLLTTRTQALGSLAQRIEVETMGLAEATLFLLSRAKLLAPDAFLDQVADTSLAVAETLAIEMDFLPLALDQAGAYIEEVGCSISTFLELYREHRKTLLHRRGHMPSEHPESVAATWSLSFKKIEQANPAAADLLRLCAFLEPDAIPEELISKGSAHLGSILSPVAKDLLQLDEVIQELRKFSLLQCDPEAKLLHIHRLVQAVIKDAMDMREQKQWAKSALMITSSIFPAIVEMTTWSRCRRYLPQAQTCTILIQEYGFTFVEAATLLHQTACYLQDSALFGQAEPLFEQALQIREQILGLEHLDVAASLYKLATLYQHLGKYKQAESFFERALQIREQTLGLEHLDVATSLYGLALLYRRQGKFEQAESLFERALQIREQVLEPLHPDVAASLYGLALLYRQQGRFEQAEPLFERALQIREQVLEPWHPDVAEVLNGLANLYAEQKRYEEAEKHYGQVMRMWEHILGPQHINIAVVLNNLAALSYEQGRYEQAEPLYRRALCIYQQALGYDHPKIAKVLNGLANVSYEQGRYEQAEPLYERALCIREQELGPQHPDVAEVLSGLANLFHKQGRYEQAEPLYERALHIREQTLGLQHPHTTKLLLGLTELYQHPGR